MAYHILGICGGLPVHPVMFVRTRQFDSAPWRRSGCRGGILRMVGRLRREHRDMGGNLGSYPSTLECTLDATTALSSIDTGKHSALLPGNTFASTFAIGSVLALLLVSGSAFAGGGDGGGSAGGAGGGIDASHVGQPGQDGQGSAAGGGGGGPGANGGDGTYGSGPGSAGVGGNAGTAAGANGGAGGDVTDTTFAGGGGGGGGAHGYVGATIPTGTFTGGDGGRGGNATGTGVVNTGGDGGGGGAGGYGAVVTGGGTGSVLAGDSLSGGQGGTGGDAVYEAGDGGDGGAGLAYQGSSLTVEGNLNGGVGGASGNTTSRANGGDGGIGLILDAGSLVQAGHISGGTGGIGIRSNGSGGTGIYAIRNSVIIVNSGSVSGGMSGDTTSRANAIGFAGGANRLELRNGSEITGNVDATVGTDDTFALGGGVASAFDVSAIGDSAQIRGFETFEKTGASTWTLTGTTTALMPWTVTGGTLNISSDASLGDSAGVVDLAGGTLQAGATFSSARDLRVGSPASNNIDTNGFDLTLSGVVADGANNNSGNFLNKLGAGTLTLSGANTYSNRTLINSGTLALSGAGTIGAGNVIIDAGTVFDISQVDASARVIQLNGTASSIINLGSKTLVLGFGNSFSDWSGAIADGGIGGGSGGDVIIAAPGGAVRYFNPQSYTGGTTIESGALELVGAGTLDAAGAMTMNAGTVFNIGGLVPAGTTIGDLNGAGAVALGNKSLTFGTANDGTFAGAFAGTGSLIKQGSGTQMLSGNSAYTGGTTVSNGTLQIEGSLGNTATSVASGATLGGSGSIAGGVTIADGGVIAPGSSAGTMTVGSLQLGGSSFLDYELGQANIVGGGTNDLIEITGGLTLDGTLNVTDIGGFGAGVYRLMNYGGALIDLGLTLGGLPAGVSTSDLFVQTNIDGQVNLISSAGAVLNFWDGSNTAMHDNGVNDGGDGVWNASDRSWANMDGSLNGSWNQNFAIFAGMAGTVRVDNTAGDIFFTGMQFMTDGYEIGGGTLTTNMAETVIRTDAGVRTTISAAIAGSGGLVKYDSGTLILSGSNSYTGGTAINGGTLSVSSDVNLGNAAGGLALDGGTIQNTAAFQTGRTITLGAGGGTFQTNDDLAVSGPISGTGSLTKTGNATLTLTGANSYTGNTLVESGTLIGDVSSIRGNIKSDGTVIFSQADNAAFAGNIGGSGDMVKDGDGTLLLGGHSSLDWKIEKGLLNSAAERFGGNVSIDAGSGLIFDQGVNATYAGIVSGSGNLVKNGTAGLVLSGDSTAFTGTTTLASGVLAVNGTLNGTLDVLADGRLQGTGTVGTTILSGTIAPGNSIGTLTVNGDYTQLAGSSYEVEIDPSGKSDLIDVSGAAKIEGGTLFALKAPGGYDAGTRYTVLTAAEVTGTYDVLDQNAPFVDLTLTYDPVAVYLDVTRNAVSFCDVAATGNQCATGNGAESLGHGNPVYHTIAGLPDGETARVAFDQLSGEIHASVKGAMLEDSRFPREAATARIRAAFEGPASQSLPVFVYRPEGEATAGEGKDASAFALAPSNVDRFALWAHGFGSWGEIDGDSNAASLGHDTGGFLIGADAPIGNWRIGALAGYSHSSFDVDERVSSGSSDNYHLGIYGGTQWGALGLRTGVAYTWHRIETDRSVSLTGFADRLLADYDAGTTQIFGELGYKIEQGSFDFEPIAGLAYVNLHTDSFTEKGGAAALTSQSSDIDATFTTIGLRTSSSFALATMNASMRGMLGWRHAFGDTTPFAANAFAGGETFVIAGVPIAKDAAILEAGIDLAVSSNATLGVSYSGQIANDTREHGFKADFTMNF